MKRIIALALATLIVVTLCFGCASKPDDDLTVGASTGTTTSSPESSSEGATAPAGFVRFATLDVGGNVVVDGLTWLLNSLDESIAIDQSTALTANYSGGVLSSVSDAQGNSFSAVMIPEADGTQAIYGEQGSSADDPSVIDLSSTSSGGLIAPATLKPGTTNRVGGGRTSTTKPRTKTPTTVQKPKTISTVPKTTLSEDQQKILDEKEAINKSDMSSTEKKLALNLLNYKMDENGIFYVDHQPWQKQFGFNQIYDLASPLIQLIYGTIRVKFRYGYVYKLYPKGHEKQGQVVYDDSGNPTYETDEFGKPIPKDWMVQMWKGRYGLVMLGAEIGVYTKPSTQTSEHYYTAVKEEELIMAMDVYQQNFLTGAKKKLFTRGPESHWWLTGFVPGSFFQYNNKSEVIMVCNIQFPSSEMLEAFRAPFDAAGFRRGAPGRDNPETYTVSGNNLKFSWQYIDQDA